ncbi:hypothetical protein [Streptomyces sp. NBC_01207]|uniref:hypothetical protein n=1 Tax=Streptomyces sp. NBC_01207 TaxID=2903772 RepID=UPI002E11DFC3|nr:hypothetical protein OG457_27250 [Streptomyces sp. NBC_01207]
MNLATTTPTPDTGATAENGRRTIATGVILRRTTRQIEVRVTAAGVHGRIVKLDQAAAGGAR